MRITPAQKAERPLSVALRGSCESQPPNLSAFKESIDNSLHESERTRCIEEILASVFERVGRVCAMRGRPSDEKIEAEVLIDDRAPVFEEINKKWKLTYSPGLYAALRRIAEDIWDAAGITGFDRFWDGAVESLTAAAMKLPDAAVKRAMLARVNEVLQRHTTVAAAGNLTFSLAYVHVRAYAEELQDHFADDAAALHTELPLFVVPRLPDPAEIEEALESARRRGRRKAAKPPPPKKGRKGKGEPEPPPPEPPRELTPELRESVRATIREKLKERIRAFENVVGESTAVGHQLTRVNEIERLDTNLEPEVEDDL